MTALFRANGVTLAVLADSVDHSVIEVGETKRAVDASLVRARRATKGEWQLELVMMSVADVLATKGLVLGLGNTWDFETSLYSYKGVALSGTGVSLSSTQKKFGAQSCAITASNHAAELASGYDYGTLPWTAAFWWWNGTAWHHYVETSAGKSFVDGVYTGAPTIVSASAGELDLSNFAGATRYLDDLWVAPYVMPDAWAPLLYAFASPQPPAGKLLVDGLLIEGNTRVVTALGEVGGVKAVQTVSGVQHSLRATLTEV